MRIQVGPLGKPNNKQDTVLEIKRKSLIQYCERSELCLHFGWTKVNQKWQNGQFRRVFENLSLWYYSVTRQVSFKRTKIGGKCHDTIIQIRHFGVHKTRNGGKWGTF